MDLTVTSPDSTVPLAEDPWREVAGLFGSIGESLAVAIPCEVEVEMHRRAREVGDLPNSMIVGERFFAESQAQKVVELAHRAINLGFRAFALRADWKAEVTGRKRYAPLVKTPFSNERSAWVTFSNGPANVLHEVCAEVGHESAIVMGRSLRDLSTSTQWLAVEEQRGQDFHRWRLESSVLAGVDATSSGVREIRDADAGVIGKAHGTGVRTYNAGNGVDEKVARIAAESLRRVAVALDQFAGGFLRCVEPLSLGAYSWSDDKGVFVQHIRPWSDVACACSRTAPTAEAV